MELVAPKELKPTPVYGALLRTEVTRRSRHFEIDWFKTKDLVDGGEMTVSWVPTTDNLADFFTKKLPRERFQNRRISLQQATSDAQW